MLAIKNKFNTEKELILVPIGDVHYGDALCNTKLLKNTIDFIRTTDNAYCVLMGDLINNATKNSKSDIYGETMTPDESIMQIVDLLLPISDKIIGMVGGNHERRTSKESGISISRIIADKLNIIDKYSEESLYLFLNIKVRNCSQSKCTFRVYLTHGNGGGGKRLGSKMNAVEDMAGVVDADVYIHAHSHLKGAIKSGYYVVDNHNSKLKYAERLYVNSNSFLYYGGYGEIGGYKPSAQSVPLIRLRCIRNQFNDVPYHTKEVIEKELIAEI